MKKAHELTEIYQEAMRRRYEERKAEAIKFCEEIGEEMEKAAAAGAIKYKTVIPKTLLPLVHDILGENGYRVSTDAGSHLIWWPLV